LLSLVPEVSPNLEVILSLSKDLYEQARLNGDVRVLFGYAHQDGFHVEVLRQAQDDYDFWCESLTGIIRNDREALNSPAKPEWLWGWRSDGIR
jgi:hypothetical protein